MDANDTPKKPADLSGVQFGTGKPKEPEKPADKPMTAWDIAWGVFMGMSMFYLMVKLFG